MRDVERLLAAVPFFNFDDGLAVVDPVALLFAVGTFESLADPDRSPCVLSHSSSPPSSLRGGRLVADFAEGGGGGAPDPDPAVRDDDVAVALEGGIFVCF